MTGTETASLALWAMGWSAGACVAAAAFLLLGWKLGRESAGLAMFDHGQEPAPPDGPAPYETDPWEAAMSDGGDDPQSASCGFP